MMDIGRLPCYVCEKECLRQRKIKEAYADMEKVQILPRTHFFGNQNFRKK